MNARMCKKLLAISLILLAGCVAKEKPQQRAAPEKFVLTLNAQEMQHMCTSPIYLSDLTKSFSLPLGGDDRSVALGELLDQAVQKVFWKETRPAVAGSVPPVVTLGFDGGTGAYRDSTLYVRISLQFQVFKPNGQSYLDVAVGEASSSTESDAVVVNAALQQALGRLAGVLRSAGICRAMR
ncbi:MAG: hypothetical protein IPN27_09780 [Cellvibrionales bacterium]|jgi:hypothetical protein|nr:hypothetical protein [Cellvibrionales bacterium]HRF87038.1 hypothetical protein [Pseudomonadales bacterium]HRG50561.1 hypothetical protein [Pseudomonadales bacterium]